MHTDKCINIKNMVRIVLQFYFSCKNVYLRYIYVDTYKTCSFLSAVGFCMTVSHFIHYKFDIQIASNFSFLQTLL